MQAIFNELSAPQLAKMSKEQAFKVVLNLIQVCKQLQALDSTFKMRINQQFWNIQLDDYGTIWEYLANNDDLNDDQYLLYAVADSPYLPDEELDNDINHDLVWKTVKIITDSGIQAAYAFDPKAAPMISFATDTWENINFISVTLAFKTLPSSRTLKWIASRKTIGYTAFNVLLRHSVMTGSFFG